jgi:hypothetical protein
MRLSTVADRIGSNRVGVLFVMVSGLACQHGSTPASVGDQFEAADITASGPAPELVPEAASGTRLKAAWVVGPEGERRFRHWRDSKLDLNCRFAVAADGKWRCLPLHANYANGYTDPACTTPGVKGFAGNTERFVKNDVGGACPPGVEIRRVGKPVPESSRFGRVGHGTVGGRGVASKPTTTCELQRMMGGAADVMYEIGEVVTPETFAAATVEVERKSGGAMGISVMHAEDGAREFWGWHDGARETDCALGPAADGRLRCLPRSRTFATGAFAEGGCQRPAGTTRGKSTCADAGFVRRETTGQCPLRTSVFRGGNRLQAGYRLSGETCAAAPGEHYELGEEIPVSALVAGERRRWRPGAGPLAIQIDEVAGLKSASALYDLRLGAACRAEECDGDVRCTPQSNLFVGMEFADPECQVPLARSFANNQCPSGVASAAVIPNQSCRDRTYYKVGPRHEGPVYLSFGGHCGKVVSSNQVGPAFRVGPAIKRDELVKLMEQER